MTNGPVASKPISLSADDWTEIYYAIMNSIGDTEFYLTHGGEVIELASEWLAQMGAILEKIGPDGQEAHRYGTLSAVAYSHGVQP